MVIYANCRKFISKTNGNVFFTLSVKGERIIEAMKKEKVDEKKIKYINSDDFYNLRLVGVVAPSKEGVYKIEFKEGWRDVRDGFMNKNIFRIKEPTLTFHKAFDTAKKEVKDDLPF